MKYLLYLFLILSMIAGVYQCSKYNGSEEQRENFVEQVEPVLDTQKEVFQTIFKYTKYTLVFFVGTFILITLAFTRWRKIKVFISYNGENEPFTESIKNTINRYPIEAYYLPYSDLEHDEIIQRVSKMIRKADAVVAIPGNRLESNFTDAEIMTASTLRKPIVILVLEEEQRLPNTAYTGYPHLYSAHNTNQAFDPLSYFLLVTFRHIKVVGSILKRGGIFLKNAFIFCAFLLVFLLFILSLLKNFAVFLTIALLPYVIGIVFISIFIGLFLYLIILVFDQYRLATIARQSQLSKSLTYAELVSIFQDDPIRGQEVLNSLVKESLKKRY